MSPRKSVRTGSGGGAPEPEGPGLRTTGGAPVPLLGVDVAVTMTDLAVRTVLTQRFRNLEGEPIEAVYSFPLPEDSAVCGFEAELGGRLVKGRIEDREKAFEDYDKALAEGHSALLLDQSRPDIFVVSVGRLMPGEEATVRISHVSRAESHDRGLRLRIPTTVSPRYVPPEQLRTGDPADLDAILPPTVLGRVPYGLTMKVELSAPGPVRRIACPSHPVEVSVKGRRATVALAGRDIQLDSDFVLEIELEKPSAPAVTVCRDGDGFALMVRTRPDVPAGDDGPRDVLFVIDRSGSMQGESMEEARSALLLALKSLREGDRFNVTGFGSRWESIFDRPADCTQESVSGALKAIGGWDADMGGTEILQPLRAALESLDGKRPASIILLTDGEVGNEAEVIALAGKHRSRCRIFTFGIGRGASGTLVRGVAAASGGAAEFIYPGERIEPKVMRQMARLSGMSALSIDWGALAPGVVTPASFPAFCRGDELVAFCRAPKLVDSTIAVKAGGSTIAVCPVAAHPEDIGTDDTVALLMARSLIADLELGAATARGSAQSRRKGAKADDGMLETALRYGLVSSRTSFVAVEVRPDPDPSRQVELRRVPVALTRGWGGLMPCAAPGGMVQMACQTIADACAPGVMRSASRKGAGLLRRIVDTRDIDHPSLAEAAVGIPQDDLLELVRIQHVSGRWVMDAELEKLTGIEESILAGVLEKVGHRAEVLGTLVALYALMTRHHDREAEWRLIADKAVAWLAKMGYEPAGLTEGLSVRDWIAAAGMRA